MCSWPLAFARVYLSVARRVPFPFERVGAAQRAIQSQIDGADAIISGEGAHHARTVV